MEKQGLRQEGKKIEIKYLIVLKVHCSALFAMPESGVIGMLHVPPIPSVFNREFRRVGVRLELLISKASEVI